MNLPVDISREHDAALWQRVLADDQVAFEQVVVKYQNLVASIAYSMTGNFSLCEEVAQETFWQAWRQRNQLRDHARLAPWLCGIARNLSLQMIKNETRQPHSGNFVDVDSGNADLASQSISAEERSLVWEALAEIPENYREALVLYYREGHAVADVARALEISTDAVKQRMSRGRDMLREQLATKIEEVLVRSRPGRSLTTRIMIGIGALSASLKATSTAAAAGLGGAAAKGAAGAVAASTIKAAAATGASAGLLGGVIGAAGGLGGAFLGTWLPAQLAPSAQEREILKRSGRFLFRLSILYTLFILSLTPLLFFKISLLWYFLPLALMTLLYIGVTFVYSLKSQRAIAELRQQMCKDLVKNESPLRGALGLNRYRFRGRKYTSRWKLFGVPLVDIQFSDNDAGGTQMPVPGQAFGWVAIGDRATGLLFAVGGLARGLIAMGGIAMGGIAFGGMSLGLFSIGGLAVGWLALGGGAIGYDAVGGGAVGWHSAAGGGAMAYHVAIGGAALAHDYAVGGAAFANETNTPAAQDLAKRESMMWAMDGLIQNRTLFFMVTIFISVVPAMLTPLAYTREEISGVSE